MTRLKALIAAYPHTCRRLSRQGRLPAMERIKIEQHTVSGSAWFAGWLFTIGYLQLAFWKAVLATVLWPYYLGLWFRAVPH